MNGKTIADRPSRIWVNFGWGLIVVGLPVAIYIIRSLLLREWVVDDAAISYSFARNFAHGYGLVSQPGMPPVEGFSNPLWVILLSGCFLFGIFDPYLTPKILSIILVSGTFWLLHRAVTRIGLSYLASGGVLLLLSLNTSFIVWTSSGLENALLAVLVVAQLLACANFFSDSNSDSSLAVWAGLLGAGIALTRPDGLSLAVVFPLTLLLANRFGRSPLRFAVRPTAMYTAAFLGLFGAYLIFRRAYFGDWYPNTYYVKGGPGLSELFRALTLQGQYLHKWTELLSSLFGDRFWLPTWLVLLVGLVLILFQRPFRPHVWLLFAACTVGGFTYLVMTPDYMREFRFATPFVLLSYPCILLCLSTLLDKIPWHKALRIAILTITCALMIAQTWRIHNPRLLDYSKWPAVAFRRISNEYGTRYDHLAQYLKIDSASVLLPDIGGPLYLSRLRVYDLAGLCDRTIAKTRGVDQPAFYSYVFDTIKPTFIHTHGFFSYVSGFTRDPRFKIDYVGVLDSLEEYGGDSVLVGDWVRRDQIVGREQLLKSLHDSLAAAH